MRLTERVHTALKEQVRVGDWVIDATMGNGYDTLFLSSLVGANGRVWAFDIQEAALESTRRRLKDSPFDNVDLIQASHAQMDHLIPSLARAKIHAIVFNLGYLPGQDKGVTTLAGSTLTALESAHTLLASGHSVHVLCYTGHTEGLAEWNALSQWIPEQPVGRWKIRIHSQFDPVKKPPVWIELCKT